MGHEIHFLERLSRASVQQAETALYLYQNRRALQHIISKCGTPPDVERVAISLDSANMGPFIIINTKGEFITCLGEQMDPGSTWQVPYLQFRAYLDEYREYQKHLERFKNMSNDGIVEELFHKIFRNGKALSRKEFQEILAIQPVITFVTLRCYVQSFTTHNDNFQELRKIRKNHPHYMEMLRHHWNLIWAMTNFFVLFCSRGPGGIEQELKELFKEGIFSYGILVQGELVTSSRAIWCAGQIGRPLLAYYKEGLTQSYSFTQWLEALTGLMVIAFREQSQRKEIFSLIMENVTTHTEVKDYMTKLALDHPDQLRRILEEPDRVIQENTAAAKKLLSLEMNHPLHKPENTPSTLDVPCDIADEMANTYLINQGGSYLRDPKLGLKLLENIPWLAQASVEDLYPSHHDLIHETTTSIEIPMMDIIEGWRVTYVSRPVKTKPKIGRNEPCFCGSGKKYKKCCYRK